MNYEMNLENKYFNLIKVGKKKIEMRLNRPERRGISACDTITFKNNQTGDKLCCKVLNKATFNNFYELYASYSKSDLGYFDDELASPADMNLFYSAVEIEKYGVVAIQIEPQIGKNQ